MDNLHELIRRSGYRMPKGLAFRILKPLMGRKPLDIWSLVRESQGNLKMTAAFLQAMKDSGLLQVSKGRVALTRDGLAFCRELNIGASFFPGYQHKIDPVLRKFRNDLDKIRKSFSPKLKFDQSPTTTESLLRMASFMSESGDLAGKSVMCVGDEDFFSLLLALSKLPAHIAVADRDERVLGIIENSSRGLGLEIETHLYNPITPLPKKLSNRFDVFVARPPATVAGTSLFLVRGLESLKKGSGRHGYFTADPVWTPPEGIVEIERVLGKMDLSVTETRKAMMAEIQSDEDSKNVPIWLRTIPKEPWTYLDVVRIETKAGSRPFVEEEWGSLVYNYDYDNKTYLE
ncbi:hypothetical protein A3K63_05505 [Candidatus Micrarchaeota archaeon RBG_16_49_10]|nr:MAG: hypothetical protein A3K63_05505 [Candidatus Micrarchaeota archaeon RBG_16_49_10]